LVRGDDFAVVRPRQTYAELIALDRLPEWLG
jgi:diaminopimelate decarboxylase